MPPFSFDASRRSLSSRHRCSSRVPDMTHTTCSVLIVGAGPGGYAAAIRAGQLGLETIVVESAQSGGTEGVVRKCLISLDRFRAAQGQVVNLCADGVGARL